jgi:peptidoglycan/xylan/chitin deacetylase (PgdA/CDA1 family)
MRFLKWMGYRTLTVQDLLAAVRLQKKFPKRSVVLTFDDGYEDNYTHALPILKKFSFTAVVFLVTDHIGKKNVWDSGTIPLLNEKQIQEMQNHGIDFGSHTANHADMTQEKIETIKKELEKSRQAVESLTGRQDIAFCYPYSRLSAESKELVRQAGYVCAFSGDSGPIQQAEDIFDLMRVQVFPSTSLFKFWKKIQPWYPRWQRWQRQFKV